MSFYIITEQPIISSQSILCELERVPACCPGHLPVSERKFQRLRLDLCSTAADIAREARWKGGERSHRGRFLFSTRMPNRPFDRQRSPLFPGQICSGYS